MMNKRQKIYHCQSSNAETREFIQENEPETSNVQECTVAIVYSYNFSLCSDLLTENTRRKLTILFEHFDNQNLKDQQMAKNALQFFKNSTVSNTLVLETFCNKCKPFVDSHFAEGPRYEFKINEFNNARFSNYFYNSFLLSMRKLYKLIMERYTPCEELNNEILVKLANNKLFMNEITALNRMHEIIGEMLIFYGKRHRISDLITKCDYINKHSLMSRLECIVSDHVKNFAKECDKKLLHRMSVIRLNNIPYEFSTVIKLTYDFGDKYRELYFSPIMLNFRDGKIIKKVFKSNTECIQTTDGI